MADPAVDTLAEEVGVTVVPGAFLEHVHYYLPERAVSGRLVRRRGLRLPLPEGPVPDLGIYLLGAAPPAVAWEARWLRWPDFGLPAVIRGLSRRPGSAASSFGSARDPSIVA